MPAQDGAAVLLPNHASFCLKGNNRLEHIARLFGAAMRGVSWRDDLVSAAASEATGFKELSGV